MFFMIHDTDFQNTSVVSVAENIRKSQVSGKMYSMGSFSFWVSCFAHSLILQKLFMNIKNRIKGNFGLLKGIQNFDFYSI